MSNPAPHTRSRTTAVPYIVIQRALHAVSLTDVVILDEGWTQPGMPSDGLAVVFPSAAVFAAFAYHMGRFVDPDNKYVVDQQAAMLRSACITPTDAGILAHFPGYHLSIGPRCRNLASAVAAELGHKAPVAAQAAYTA